MIFGSDVSSVFTLYQDRLLYRGPSTRSSSGPSTFSLRPLNLMLMTVRLQKSFEPNPSTFGQTAFANEKKYWQRNTYLPEIMAFVPNVYFLPKLPWCPSYLCRTSDPRFGSAPRVPRRFGVLLIPYCTHSVFNLTCRYNTVFQMRYLHGSITEHPTIWPTQKQKFELPYAISIQVFPPTFNPTINKQLLATP